MTSTSGTGWGRAVLVLLFGGAAAVATLQLVPASQHHLGPTTVATEGRVGPGRTTLVLPPLGTVTADTHRSPLSVEATLAQVDVTRLASSVPRPRDASGSGQRWRPGCDER